MSVPVHRCIRPWLTWQQRPEVLKQVESSIETCCPTLNQVGKQETQHRALLLLEDEYFSGDLDVTCDDPEYVTARVHRAVVFAARTAFAVRRWQAGDLTDESEQEGLLAWFIEYRRWRKRVRRVVHQRTVELGRQKKRRRGVARRVLRVRWAFEKNEHRQRQRAVGGDAVLGAADRWPAPRADSADELLEKMDEFMRTSTADRQQIYRMRRAGQKAGEIAAATGKKKGTVRVTLHRIRESLLEEFGDAVTN